MTDKEKLLLWTYNNYKNWAFKTSDVLRWGVSYYSNRADRNARNLTEQGYLRRLNDDERMKYGHFGKEWSYILTEKGREYARTLGQRKFDFKYGTNLHP